MCSQKARGVVWWTPSYSCCPQGLAMALHQYLSVEGVHLLAPTACTVYWGCGLALLALKGLSPAFDAYTSYGVHKHDMATGCAYAWLLVVLQGAYWCVIGLRVTVSLTCTASCSLAPFLPPFSSLLTLRPLFAGYPFASFIRPSREQLYSHEVSLVQLCSLSAFAPLAALLPMLLTLTACQTDLAQDGIHELLSNWGALQC